MERQFEEMSDSNSNVIMSKSFTDRMFRRLFWPTLISAIGLGIGDVADSLFVGIRLGKVGLATMSLVAPVYMIYNVLDVGIALGASVKYTQALGKGEARKGCEIFTRMLVTAFIVSAAVSAFGIIFLPYILRVLGAGPEGGELWNYTYDYLRIMFLGAPLTFIYFLLYYCIRCDDAEKLASVGFTVGYLTDVIASAVFILGLHLDVRGAIYATVLGKAVGIFIFSFHFTRKWAILRIVPCKPSVKAVISALKTGMSSSVGFIGQFIALIVVNNLLMRMGGDSALAQFNVIQNVSYLALSLYTAIGDTVQPLSGTFFAEHNRGAISRVMQLGNYIGIIAGASIAAITAILVPSICRLFGLEGEIIESGAFAVRVFCLSIVPAGFNIVWSSCFQATKREKLVFLINQLRTFVCFLIFAFVFSQYGLKWFWFAFLGAESLTFLIWVQIAFFHKQEVSDKVFTYLIDASSCDISELLSKAEAFCEENDANPKQSYCVMMCIEEVCQAIIDNAFKQNGNEYIQMTLCCEKDGTFVIHIRDNAVKFNPFAMKTGQNYEDAEHLASLGIQMVKTKSKQFFYRRYANFNTLTVEVE